MRKSLHNPACRLTIANLKSLIKILEQGMGDKKSLSLSYELKGTEMSFDSLDELLEHTDTPSTLYSLYLSAYYEDLNKRAGVYFYDGGPPYVVVEGKDEAWVIGKSKQIENFLINKKARLAFLHGGKLYFILLIAMIVGLILNSSQVLNFIPSKLFFYSISMNKLISAFGILSSLLLMYISLLKIKPKFLYPYTKIKLREGWDINTKLNLGMLVLAILGIIVTISLFIISEILMKKPT